MLNIGQAAAQSGVSAKMIRHYEASGLLAPAQRTDAGYRQYGTADVQTLRFIRQARQLGFSLQEVDQLLSLWRDRQRPSREVKALAQVHLDELARKVAELQAMQATLEQLVHGCQGNDRPECPILDQLATPGAAAAVQPRRPGGKTAAC
jgi:MerR family copper efflux transcriptional regulator